MWHSSTAQGHGSTLFLHPSVDTLGAASLRLWIQTNLLRPLMVILHKTESNKDFQGFMMAMQIVYHVNDILGPTCNFVAVNLQNERCQTIPN